jgi:hypothetical protein
LANLLKFILWLLNYPLWDVFPPEQFNKPFPGPFLVCTLLVCLDSLPPIMRGYP